MPGSYADGVSWGEPDEWHGRGPRSRDGWPTSGGGGQPGGPRSHRARRAADDTGEITDTGLHFEHPPQDQMQVIHVVQPPRRRGTLEVIRDLAIIAACLVVLAFAGLTYQHHGVPLWLP